MPAAFFEPLSDHKTPPLYRYFDGGQWREGESGKSSPVVSPIDGSIVGYLPTTTTKEIDAVFATATKTQAQWRATPLFARVKLMHLSADWIRHFEAYLTNLLVREIGKSHEEAKSEIVRTADLIDYFADEVQSIKGDALDSDNFPGFEKGRLALIERVPLGTVVCIGPFNYPINLSASKIAPALLMGNTVVFKPPTQGGISALHLFRCFEKAGVPVGVMGCVTGGGGEIGDYLVGHKEGNMVAFTGNSNTGLSISSKAIMKPLLFECGGNNPAVVFPDADMSLAAREIVKGAFSYAGQRCTAIKYVMGTKVVLDALLPLVVKTTEELVHVGDPRSPHTKLVGPVISVMDAVHIEQVIDEAKAEGAHVACGGTRDRTYITPTILTGVKPSMRVVKEEIFGPVVSFIAIQNMQEAVDIINASRFGLQASVFTKDEGTGLVFAKQLNVGTVQINGSPQRGPDHFPFLGVKESGVGVQGVRYSLEAMSRFKPIVINKPS